LAGPAFIAVFTIFCIVIGFTSDRIRSSRFGRHRLMAIGVITFSIR
jgi:MFS family permease